MSCFQVCQRPHSHLVLCSMLFEQVPGTSKQVKASGDFGKGFFVGGPDGSESFFIRNSQIVMARSTTAPQRGRTCLDFRVPARCALLVSCLGFWVVKASLKRRYVVSTAAVLPPPYLS